MLQLREKKDEPEAEVVYENEENDKPLTREPMTNASHNSNPRTFTALFTDDIQEASNTDAQARGVQEDSVHFEDEAEEVLTDKWSRDANRVCNRLEKADESGKGYKSWPMPDGTW